MNSASAQLAAFAANLRWEAIPAPVQNKAHDLMVDWFASAVAGCRSRPVQSIARFAQTMGPQQGLCELIGQTGTSGPYLAALVNAAASHMVEQDDVHNGSVFHPATVVFPVVLAVAQAHGASGAQGMAAAMSSDARPACLSDQLGTRWATAETSFKYHACCRHTHPAADALAQVMQSHRLRAAELKRVIAHVHQGAIDVLGSVLSPSSVHQSKFSMGTVLALVARFGHAGLVEFEQHYAEQETRSLCERVEMLLDAEVDAAYPQRWMGKVTVYTFDGREFKERIDEPKGDPGNPLSRAEITAKALRLAAFGGVASDRAMRTAVDALWTLSDWPRVGRLLEGQHDLHR